jgi:hypothetical protein
MVSPPHTTTTAEQRVEELEQENADLYEHIYELEQALRSIVCLAELVSCGG